MKTTILTALLCISLAFNLGFALKAFWPCSHKPHKVHKTHTDADGTQKKEWRTCSDNLKLGLTCEQVGKLQAFKKEYNARIKPLQVQLKKERAQLLELLKLETVQKEAIHKVLKNISSLQNDIQKAFVRHFFQLKTIMSSEQAQKFCTYMGECLAGPNSGKCKITLRKEAEQREQMKLKKELKRLKEKEEKKEKKREKQK